MQNSKENYIVEFCPHCEAENEIQWDIETEGYEDFKLACNTLKQRAEEINECWEQAFDNGEIRQGYCLDENDFLFEIWEDGYYVTSHTRIQIIEKEVN